MIKPTYEELQDQVRQLREIVEKNQQTRKELEESRRQYANLTKNIAVGIFRTTAGSTGSFVQVNPAFVSMLGYDSAEELKQKNAKEVYFYPAAREMYLKKISDHTFVQNEELVYKRKDGTPITISETAIAVRDDSGEIIYIEGVTENITARKAAEQELLLQKTYYERLFNSAAEAIILHDTDDIVTDINEEFTRMFGFTRDEAIGKPINTIVASDDYQDDAALLSDLVTHGQKVEAESKRRKKDGSLFDVSILGAPIFHEGGQIGIYAIYRDITDQKLFEEQVQNDLEEKEVLLKEIHHRVKNNLNVITSLLGLQARKITNREHAIEAFQECRERIFSMALVHERLYQSKDFSHVDMGTYINDISRKLVRAYSIHGKIEIGIEADNVSLDINTAIPCGLILNELITNALKHAFPEKQGGTLTISFNKRDETGYQLSIQDNGIGLNTETRNLDNCLGMELVDILIDQLGGTLDILVNDGTTFTITFPITG